MSAIWIHWGILVFGVFVIVLIHAYVENRLSDLPRILLYGASSGAVFGVPSDVMYGMFLPTYTLAYTPTFVTILCLGYGLFAANTLLMQRAGFLNFCVWSLIPIILDEFEGFYFHLWAYPFPFVSIEYIALAIIVPLLWAVLLAIFWHVLFRYRFAFIDNVIKW